MDWLTSFVLETVAANLSLGLFFTIALGVYLAFWTVLFVLPIIPGFIEKLTNKPNRNRGKEKPSTDRWFPVSKFGFFTELLPGRVKIIERGGDFIACLMSYEDHVFKGEIPPIALLDGIALEKNDDEYWEVLETHKIKEELKRKGFSGKNNVRDSHPIGKWKLSWSSGIFIIFSWPWWLWKRWVLKLTGFVFTGIYPFQSVRTYPLEYFVKIKHGSSGEEEIKRIEDYSDHFRVADFQFPVRIPSADTKDKIPVKVLVDLMARVFNPYETAYWIDDWSARVAAAVTDEVTHFTRPRDLDYVLSAKNVEEVRELSDSIKRLGDRKLKSEEEAGPADKKQPSNSLVPIGIQITQVLVPDISQAPIETEDERKLADEAFARVERKAMEHRAEGRASEIRKQAEAIRDNGHIGLAVLAAERNVRTAKEAGDKAIVVVGGGSDVDPIQAAILHELKKP